MKKILIILGAVLMMTACKKEQSEVATVTLRFSPYEVSPIRVPVFRRCAHVWMCILSIRWRVTRCVSTKTEA